MLKQKGDITGYTNYWTVAKKYTKEQRKKMVAFTNKAIELSEVDVAFEYNQPQRKPNVSQKQIRFNGIGVDDGHETFALLDSFKSQHYSEGHRFCKTARKPYDEIVKACLFYAEMIGVVTEFSFDGVKDVSPIDTLESDPKIEEEECRKGWELFRKTLAEV